MQKHQHNIWPQIEQQPQNPFRSLSTSLSGFLVSTASESQRNSCARGSWSWRDSEKEEALRPNKREKTLKKKKMQTETTSKRGE